MASSSSGCPVQHAPKEPSSTPVATAAAGNESTASTESEQASGRRWSSRVAAWLPFRQGDGGGSDGSAAKGSGEAVAPAPAAIQGSTARQGTKEEHGGGGGGCPVNSSAEDGGDDAVPPSSSSGCPVQHGSATTSTAAPAEGLGRVWGYLTGSIGGAGGDGDISSATAPAPEAPELYNARNNEYVYGQEVAAGQEVPLSTSRQRSSIPKAEFNPDHQPQKEAEKWVYPSEQQYYNAIKRKGYKASAADMPSTLAIHNAVNEKGWEMVQEWERAHAEAAATATPAAEGGGAPRRRPPPGPPARGGGGGGERRRPRPQAAPLHGEAAGYIAQGLGQVDPSRLPSPFRQTRLGSEEGRRHRGPVRDRLLRGEGSPRLQHAGSDALGRAARPRFLRCGRGPDADVLLQGGPPLPCRGAGRFQERPGAAAVGSGCAAAAAAALRGAVIRRGTAAADAASAAAAVVNSSGVLQLLFA
ncbi:unnamed protein product [Ectocarpus sp. 12 AP-2014]